MSELLVIDSHIDSGTLVLGEAPAHDTLYLGEPRDSATLVTSAEVVPPAVKEFSDEFSDEFA